MTLIFYFAICWVFFLLFAGIKLFNKGFKKISIRRFINRCAFKAQNKLRTNRINFLKSDIIIKMTLVFENTFLTNRRSKNEFT